MTTSVDLAVPNRSVPGSEIVEPGAVFVVTPEVDEMPLRNTSISTPGNRSALEAPGSTSARPTVVDTNTPGSGV